MAKSTTYLTSAIAAALVFALCNTTRAAGTAEQRRACTQDALKFCLSEVPDVQRITACMKKNLNRLSPRCRAQFE